MKPVGGQQGLPDTRPAHHAAAEPVALHQAQGEKGAEPTLLCAVSFCLQSMCHLAHRAGRVRRALWDPQQNAFANSRCGAHVSCQSAARSPLSTVLDVRLTQVAIVGQRAPHPTEFPGQRLELVDHRRKLLLVVGGLRQVIGHDEQTPGGDGSLRDARCSSTPKTSMRTVMMLA
jgi:hypothetical protein